MSLSLVQSRALLGLEAAAVTVEVHLANGLPSFTLVGLADVEVKEARERVRSALQNAGLEFPGNKRITVNLAPADLPKDSGRFDLPIALGILAASGQIDAGKLAAIFHIEGAEAIDTDFRSLEVLYAAGLRSIGIVWSRANAFGTGVPFRHNSDPDIGPGLSDAGKELVRVCNRMGIMLDMSHLNAAGFRDVAAITDRPIVATHSNVHGISPHARNLTDWQLSAIAESRGVVGLNYATGFLRPDGQMRADTEIEIMVRHIDALVQKLGEDGVALGSDFDGATIPAPIKDVTGVTLLLQALLDKGYGEPLVRKIALGNWMSVLERTWG